MKYSIIHSVANDTPRAFSEETEAIEAPSSLAALKIAMGRPYKTAPVWGQPKIDSNGNAWVFSLDGSEDIEARS